jgi:hypothetical protein
VLLLDELGAKGVESDIDSSSISFEGQNFMHDVRCWRAKRCAEVLEVFKASLIYSVTDDFNIQVVEIGCRETVSEVGG